MGYNDEKFGVWVAPDNDFYPMSDLSDKEIYDLAGHLSNSLSQKQ